MAGSPYLDSPYLTASDGGTPSITASGGNANNSIAITPSGVGTSILTGAQIATGAAPTISSGFGTGATIIGNNSRFIVTTGTGTDTGGNVLFSASQPFAAGKTGCTATDNTTNNGYIWPSVSSSALSVTLSGTFTAGDKIVVSCGGYQ